LAAVQINLNVMYLAKLSYVLVTFNHLKSLFVAYCHL